MAASLRSRNPGLDTRPSSASRSSNTHGFSSARTLILGLSKIIFATLPAATVSAAPVLSSIPGLSSFDAVSKQSGLAFWSAEHGDSDDPDGAGSSLLVLYVASAVLVLLGGAFAGLTIALMGQDSIYLQVLSRDDTDPQQKNAKRVYDLLQRGKHWVLVTLLLSNVIVNETLPVVLDRCLGGGVAAVVGSTLLIVVFGEVLPQSICVRYGLQIGGIMAKPVLALMWLMAPIAWPTAKVLDHALGEDHGTVYKKSGLKTLMTLHRSLGEVSERLNQDEVTIISAVLDLKEKPVSSVMTPMNDVFIMSEDTVLDEKMMDMILSAGYSRIPIHEPFSPTNFVGMLLVKILITYDPDDKMRVGEFPLATLPETRPETSCLDIVNFFQEGKSHMVLVSQYPGEDHGALGVVTLEDVIEELIGEEIIDESDVYIDVHKAIRRLQPAPRARPTRNRSLAPEFSATSSSEATRVTADEDGESSPSLQQQTIPVLRALSRVDSHALSTSPKMTTVMMRRCSTGADGRMTQSTVPVRANIDEMWQHLRHLGPSNRANNPKNTRSTTVKIKQGHSHAGHLTGSDRIVLEDGTNPRQFGNGDIDADIDANETSLLLGPNAASVDADAESRRRSRSSSPNMTYGTLSAAQESDIAPGDIVALEVAPPAAVDDTAVEVATRTSSNGSDKSKSSGQQQLFVGVTRNGGSSSEGSPDRLDFITTLANGRTLVRSGSITENVIETRGIRKVVLQTTSLAEDDDEAGGASGGAVSGTSHSNHRSLLSAAHSPATHSSHEDKAAKKKELEAALLAAKADTTSPPTPAPVIVPSTGVVASPIEEAVEETESAEAEAEAEGGSVNGGNAAGTGSSAAGGNAAAKKKNRRKKRKGTK